jgi:chorismate mutase
MASRGIRGAITVSLDTAEEVLKATSQLLETIHNENGFKAEDIASILFTVTSDIKSVYPAEAARSMGWDTVPLLCFQDMEVLDALPRCIRVLVTINTAKGQDEIRHIYMREAKKLRQDLVNK